MSAEATDGTAFVCVHTRGPMWRPLFRSMSAFRSLVTFLRRGLAMIQVHARLKTLLASRVGSRIGKRQGNFPCRNHKDK